MRDRLLDLRVTLSDGSTAAVSSSVGVARFDRTVSVDAALGVADEEMYSTKRSRNWPSCSRE